MANIHDYLDWRGDLKFEEFGINEIDGNLQSNENIKVADDNLYTAKKEE